MTVDTVGMEPYLAGQPSERRTRLESLHRTLLHLQGRVDEKDLGFVKHCLEMLSEAFPDVSAESVAGWFERRWVCQVARQGLDYSRCREDDPTPRPDFGGSHDDCGWRWEASMPDTDEVRRVLGIDGYRDREPQPTDGPEYHADHQAWVERQTARNDGSPDAEG